MRLFGVAAALLVVLALAIAAGPLSTRILLRTSSFIRGNFTLNAPVPAGAKLPSGTIFTMTIGSRTNQGLDGGVESLMPEIYAIGEPEPLPLAAG